MNEERFFKTVEIKGCEFHDVIEDDGWLYIRSDIGSNERECLGTWSEVTSFEEE